MPTNKVRITEYSVDQKRRLMEENVNIGLSNDVNRQIATLRTAGRQVTLQLALYKPDTKAERPARARLIGGNHDYHIEGMKAETAFGFQVPVTWDAFFVTILHWSNAVVILCTREDIAPARLAEGFKAFRAGKRKVGHIPEHQYIALDCEPKVPATPPALKARALETA